MWRQTLLLTQFTVINSHFEKGRVVTLCSHCCPLLVTRVQTARRRFHLSSLVQVESYEAGLVQPLPQTQLHAQVVVGEETHPVVHFVVVVVRILLIVGGHEAVGAHLHRQTDRRHKRHSETL